MIWTILLYVTLVAVALSVTFAWIDPRNRWDYEGQIGASFFIPLLGGMFLGLSALILTGSGYSTSQFTKDDETVYTVQEGADISVTSSYVNTVVNVNGKPEALEVSSNRTTFVSGDKNELKVELYKRVNPVTVPWDMPDERFVTITQGK
jgi:hypothetical protein